MTGSPAAVELFLRLLGVVYAVAFLSLFVQIDGLFSSRGLSPFLSYLPLARRQLGKSAFFKLPSLFLFRSDDLTLKAAAIGGALVGMIVAAGWTNPLPLALLYLLYLSYVSAGEEFLSYQWDALLLETGFLSIFVAAAPGDPLAVWSLRVLLFRFMVSSGAVKLTSRDPTWRDLTAMTYHYWTQPLPNSVSWHVHHLPRPFHKMETAGTFFMEIGVPFLVFGPEPFRLVALALLVLLQILIAVTGNFGFFNLQTVVLCIPLLPDSMIPLTSSEPATMSYLAPVFLFFIFLNLLHLLFLFKRPAPLRLLMSLLAPWRISNGYGLFAVMTTWRYEYVIEGSNDGKEWREYGFRWKPGDVRRRPGQAAPHMPRLDWQMWFAALQPGVMEPWLDKLLLRILQGEKRVLALLKHDPFGGTPPRYVRLALYDYTFTDPAEKKLTGAWWKRSLMGRYRRLSLKA